MLAAAIQVDAEHIVKTVRSSLALGLKAKKILSAVSAQDTLTV